MYDDIPCKKPFEFSMEQEQTAISLYGDNVRNELEFHNDRRDTLFCEMEDC